MSDQRHGTVAVVGAGGNIGSHAVPHVARMPGVRAVILVDPDVYTETNGRNQDADAGDVGRPKVVVQAERVRRINPTIAVTALAEAVENVPLGLLRADVVLACLDSRAARLVVNTVAWRLGVPWVDAGVRGDALLARVNVYRPLPSAPCYECAWDDADYRNLEQAYPCGDASPRPTNAPSSLGALAAALQTLECRKVLDGHWETTAVGAQVTISALAHTHYVTRFRANPRCRFDHATWEVDSVGRDPAAMTLAEIFSLGRDLDGPLRLGVAQQRFARALHCLACGRRKAIALHLFGRLPARERACGACGVAMRPSGFDEDEWLAASAEDATLDRVGVRPGDVLTVAGESAAIHVQIGGRA